MKISKFFWGHAPRPPILSYYAAEFALATSLFTIYILVLETHCALIIKSNFKLATATPTDHVIWPDWFKNASYGPVLKKA